MHRLMAKASIAFSKLRHCLWGQKGVKLDTKIQVYKAVIISILLYGSETWTPYRSQINQLDVFPKRCLRSICGYTLGDKITNADLFARCRIGGIETFHKKSQLKWADHVLKMSDERISKILMYGELKDGKRNTGRPWLLYRDKLKYNLSATKIPVGSFEDLAQDRNKWRTSIRNGISDFEVNRIEKLNVAGSGTRVCRTQSSILSDTAHYCSICGLVCKSLAGLKSHNRYKHSN